MKTVDWGGNRGTKTPISLCLLGVFRVLFRCFLMSFCRDAAHWIYPLPSLERAHQQSCSTLTRKETLQALNTIHACTFAAQKLLSASKKKAGKGKDEEERFFAMGQKKLKDFQIKRRCFAKCGIPSLLQRPRTLEQNWV